MADLPEYVEVNRAHWNRQAPGWVEAGRRAWAATEPRWGIWGVPNAEVSLLPEDLRGLDAVELGCGTGYVSAWMARRGARVLAVDPSKDQLATARSLAREHGVTIEFLQGIAEAVPRPDASFDFAISEYGAAIWADPYLWIPEAWRLLRPGGRLAFLGNTPWSMVCTPHVADGITGERLENAYFGMRRFDWSQVEDGGIEFCLSLGDWFRLFRETGFAVDDYYELQAPPGAGGVRFATSGEWARQWPAEHAFLLRRKG